MADTTETTNDGSIDAVAASLFAAPAVEPEEQDPAPEAREAVEDGDTVDQEPEDAAEADDGEADETDDATQDADADESETAALIPVKVNGKTELRTLDELKQSFSGQAYIQQRMQETASLRKEAEAVFHALAQEREQLAAFADQLRTGQVPMQPPTPPSRDLLERDPIGYIEAQAKFNEEQQAYAATMQHLAAMQAQQAELTKRAQGAALQEQMQLLTRAIPEFADAEAGAKLRDKIVRGAVDSYGFDPSELMAVTDHRQVRVLHDAMLYRQMMAERGRVDEKVKTARPVVKPGAKQTGKTGAAKRIEQSRAKMRQSGSVDDVAKYLLS